MNYPKNSRSNLLYYLLVTAGGAGSIRFAPGTWGAAVGALIYALLIFLPEPVLGYALGVLLLGSCVCCVALGKWSETYFARKDAPAFVLDEVAGIWLTLLLFRIPQAPLLTLLWAFPLTRLLDIVKLPPARQLEKLPHGWGILLDDLMSSLYAGGLLLLLRTSFPAWFVA